MIRKHKKSLLAKQGTVLLLILSQLAALTACGGSGNSKDRKSVV